jgi:hypothetical protein
MTSNITLTMGALLPAKKADELCDKAIKFATTALPGYPAPASSCDHESVAIVISEGINVFVNNNFSENATQIAEAIKKLNVIKRLPKENITRFNDRITSIANFIIKEGLKMVVHYPVLVQTKETILGKTEFKFSVGKLLRGGYNDHFMYPSLIKALKEHINDTNKDGQKTYAAKKAKTAIAKAVICLKDEDGDTEFRKNPFNKTGVNAKVVKDLADIIKETDVSWLLTGQLSERGHGNPELLETILNDYPTKDIINELFFLGYIDLFGNLTGKYDELPSEKREIIYNIYHESWFQEALAKFDFVYANQIKTDWSKSDRKSIGQLREEVDHFRGDDMIEEPEVNDEYEARQTLIGSRNYGYTAENLGFVIARMLILNEIIKYHSTFKNYKYSAVLDFLWQSGNHLILNEICHTEEMAEKFVNLQNLTGDDLFIEIFNVLNTTKGISNEMVKVKNAINDIVIKNLNIKDQIYSKTTKMITKTKVQLNPETMEYEEIEVKYPKTTIKTYGDIINDIEKQMRYFVNNVECPDSVNKALATYGMYGAGRKVMSPFYDEDAKEFYDLDWNIETPKEILDEIGVNFEIWCDKYFASKNQNKTAERQAEAAEIKADSKKGTITLSLDKILYKQSSIDDDLAKENDPNFEYDNIDWDNIDLDF